MALGEYFLENFAGDLEYHPRRAAVYVSLSIASACFWIFSTPDTKFTTIPLVFALGSLTLFVKGIFLLRKSSEGIGLSEQQVSKLSDPSNRKDLPSISHQAAQIVQDFGAGGLLLWPILHMGKGIDNSWDNAPRLQIFFAGAFLFCLGWLIRRFTSPSQT